jgi:hypothetical protein
MDGQERIIRRLFTEKRCHRCGRPYDAEQVLVLARRSEVWMVMISCQECEQKETYVVKFPPQMQGRRRVTSYRLSRPPASTPLSQEPGDPQQKRPESLDMSAAPRPPAATQPVSADDVLDMHLFLENFNGDFQRLFAEVE